MGTNYFARILPPTDKLTELKNLIDDDDFEAIKELTTALYGEYTVDFDGNPTGGIVHLGKKSYGWEFLWNPNVYMVKHWHIENGRLIRDPSTPYYTYPLNKEGILNFINRDDVVLMDEYNEEISKEEFIGTAFIKQNGECNITTYYQKHPNEYRYQYKVANDLVEYLQSQSIELDPDTHSEFYSDGLRFSTSTEFS